MKKARFSFVIPTLNEKNYIKDCIASIRKQTRKDLEIIVVDSYSRDGTAKTAKRMGVKVVFEKRKGVAIARNTGAKHATGDVLVFADADARFDKDFLERLEKMMTERVGGGIFKLVPYDADKRLHSLFYTFANAFARFMTSVNVGMSNGTCFVYRRSVFDEAGGFDPKFVTNDDHNMAGRAARLKPFVFFKSIRVGTSSRRIKRGGPLGMSLLYIKLFLMYLLNDSYVPDSSVYWDK